MSDTIRVSNKGAPLQKHWQQNKMENNNLDIQIETNNDAAQNPAKKSVIGVVVNSLKRSTAEQHKKDVAAFNEVKRKSSEDFEKNRGKNTYAKAKADFKENHEKATAPNPDFEEFKDAIKSKFKK